LSQRNLFLCLPIYLSELKNNLLNMIPMHLQEPILFQKLQYHMIISETTAVRTNETELGMA
jgi:hypothetical protein